MDQAQLQAQIQQLQTLGQQLQAAAQQRRQFEALQAETDRAKEVVEGIAEDAPVYRNVGPLLVKEAGRDAALERLGEQSETLELRVQRMKSQEEQLRKSFEELQEQVQSALQP